MVRRGRLTTVVAFLIECAVLLLVVGCSGTRSEPAKEKGRTEATNIQQERTSEAASEEEARCQGTRTTKGGVDEPGLTFITNDLPGCPKGGLLKGTNGRDKLFGWHGDDEIRGLGEEDDLRGGVGDDVIYGGSGRDFFKAGWGDDVLYGGPDGDDMSLPGRGEDVIYGGDGNDMIDAKFEDADRDELYCGKGKDLYAADKKDFVDSSCEKKVKSMWGTM